MRKNYPVSSEELNDVFQDLYYKLTYILGYDDDDNATTEKPYRGQFDMIEHRIREAVYLILFQENETKDKLILNKGTNNEVALYSVFGKRIIIDELRSM
jgi:hypothetical protein